MYRSPTPGCDYYNRTGSTFASTTGSAMEFSTPVPGDPFDVISPYAYKAACAAPPPPLKKEWPYDGDMLKKKSPPSPTSFSLTPPLAKIAAVLDWDDTLFPTSWIRRVQSTLLKLHGGGGMGANVQDISFENDVEFWCSFELKHLSTSDRVLLRRLELSSIDLLRACLEKCDYVYVVSNAQLQWVILSGQKYMPKLWSFISKHKIPLLSARDLHQMSINENEPDVWKLNTFQAVVRQLLEAAAASPVPLTQPSSKSRVRSAPNLFAYGSKWLKVWGSATPPNPPAVLGTGTGPPHSRRHHKRIKSTDIARKLNRRGVLLSIGDSECERMALLKCLQIFKEEAYFKSVKLVDTPHPLLLKKQQEYVIKSLVDILQLQESLDIVFQPPP